jgi:hypothetical protein
MIGIIQIRDTARFSAVFRVKNRRVVHWSKVLDGKVKYGMSQKFCHQMCQTVQKCGGSACTQTGIVLCQIRPCIVNCLLHLFKAIVVIGKFKGSSTFGCSHFALEPWTFMQTVKLNCLKTINLLRF